MRGWATVRFDSAISWSRRRLHQLARHRRAQLLAALVLGAVLGGGFVAALITEHTNEHGGTANFRSGDDRGGFTTGDGH